MSKDAAFRRIAEPLSADKVLGVLAGACELPVKEFYRRRRDSVLRGIAGRFLVRIRCSVFSHKDPIMKTFINLSLALLATLLLLGLPLLGVAITGKPLSDYTEFPPLTQHVIHAGFSYPAFIGLAIFILVVTTPIILRVLASNLRKTPPPFGVRCSMFDVRRSPSTLFPLPWWGWLGLASGLVAWVLAWTRFPWFASLQQFTFSPLWFAYILVINALTFRRTGRCMLLNRPVHFLLLFPLSAAFWWFFEYLNRFVQNWYYHGILSLTPAEYVLFATLPFATVLPAVMGTHDLLRTFPRLTCGLDQFITIPSAGSLLQVAIMFPIACISLVGIAIWPDIFFPMLWISPLMVVTSLQALRGQPTVFTPLAQGNWTSVVRLAIASLICGFFWEMWNYGSLAQWIYTVPFVQRFHLFEMPILGYTGYLPFGLECAAISSLLDRFNTPSAEENET